MAARVASAALGIPILVAAVWFGSPWVSFLVVLISTLALTEFYDLATRIGAKPYYRFGLAWGLTLVLTGHFEKGRFSIPIIVIGLIPSLLWLLWHRRRPGASSDWLYSTGGAFYTGWVLSHALLLRNMENGRELVLFIVMTTFATDTGAFFIGRLTGHRPLAPSISPGKTWEGAWGGLFTAVVASIALHFLLDIDPLDGIPLPLWQTILLGAAIGVLAQIGDLLESRMKRLAGVKDAGKIIPGHGGLMDRLDSIVFPLLLVYYFVKGVS